MNVFTKSASRPKRLRDYGAFQTDVSTLDTLTTTAVQQDRHTEALSSSTNDIHNAGRPMSRFPVLTIPSRSPLKPEISASNALLLRIKKVTKQKWPGLLIRFCVTVVLLAYLLKSLSWQTILVALAHVHLSNLLIGFVVGSSAVVLSAYQWRGLLRAQSIRFDFADLIKLYLVGIALSHFLPTGFGGDAFKSFYVGRKAGNGVGATVATIMCRITGFFAMLLLVCPVLIISHAQFPFNLTVSFTLLCLLGCSVIVGMLFFVLLLPTLSKNRWARHSFFLRVAEIGTVLHKSVLMPRSMFGAIVCGTVFWLVAILNCSVYATALGIHEPLVFYFLAVPLVAIIASLPISLNGFGVREGTFVYILSFVHVIPATALLLVFLLDLQTLFFAFCGSCIYFTLSGGKRNLHFGKKS